MKSGVLFVSPSLDDGKSLGEMLIRVGIPVRQAADVATARQLLDRERFAAVLTESRLPDGNWLDVLKLAGVKARRLAVVVTDRLADARFWADVLDSGAYDVLAKPFFPGEVQRILANAMHEPPVLVRSAPAA
jgi:two-component system, NtrC family, response regulator PilR